MAALFKRKVFIACIQARLIDAGLTLFGINVGLTYMADYHIALFQKKRKHNSHTDIDIIVLYPEHAGRFEMPSSIECYGDEAAFESVLKSCGCKIERNYYLTIFEKSYTIFHKENENAVGVRVNFVNKCSPFTSGLACNLLTKNINGYALSTTKGNISLERVLADCTKKETRSSSFKETKAMCYLLTKQGWTIVIKKIYN